MIIEYLASYDRSLRKLRGPTQTRTSKAIDRLLDYFLTGQRPHGLGLKRLHKQYWEIRVGLGIRIVFELRKDRLTFVVVGSHDAIRQWLRTA